MNGLSLREQLGGSPDPDFHVRLPTGWERRSPDDDDMASFEAALKTRLMSLHRPDLFVHVRGMLREMYARMQSEGVIAFYAATSQAEDTLWIPGSMVVSVRRPPTGGTLDELVTQAIREYGAEPLFGDKRFVRFEREKLTRIDDSQILQSTLVYLTPIPGSQRRRALQFVATIGRSVDVPADDPAVQMYKTAFDLIVSTLRWVPAAA